MGFEMELGAYRMMIRSAVALVLAFAAGGSMAASFDCKKASSYAEKAICGDGYLSKVDDVLAGAYKKAITQTEDPDRLRELQREWITERDQCTTQKCLDKSLGERVSFLDNYANAERKVAYDAEQKVRKEQREVERQAQEAAAAQRNEEYKLAQEQSRQQELKNAEQYRLQQEQQRVQAQPTTVAPSAAYQAPAYSAPKQPAMPKPQAVPEKSFLQKTWQSFIQGPGWKYLLVFGFVITCWTVWRHHVEKLTIYVDYTDAGITNLLPAAGVIGALLLRWLEMPGVVQVIVFAVGVILGVAYAVYAALRTNQGALNITLVILTKITMITVFFVVIGMLIASLFSNSGRRKGESQARTAARHRREKKATMAQITALSIAYTALTAWMCRNPEFTSISDCLEFDTTPQLA